MKSLKLCIFVFSFIFAFIFHTNGSFAKETNKEVLVKAKEIVDLLRASDFVTLSKYIHFKKGIKFSPYDDSYNKFPGDMKFSANQVRNLINIETVYTWGVYDGIGDDIKLKPVDYFKKFIYDFDYGKKSEVTVMLNRKTKKARHFRHIFDWFPGSIVVQYHYKGTPNVGYNDFKRLNLVLEKVGNDWFLTGILHGEKTY